jgi:RNA polymerase sigma-70 factor (ECF subfamily)
VSDAAPAWPAGAAPLGLLFAALGFVETAAPLDEDALADVIARARAGDSGARRTLYEQHVGRVYRTVRGILRSDADAEDATQDAMLAILTSLHTYRPRPGARFAAWVGTIAVNTARRRFRRHRPELTPSGELPDVPAAGSDPADDLDRARQRQALLTALGELPERERLVVSLRYGAELDATEIGASVGMQPAAVRKLLERARTRLGERIAVLLGGLP